MTPELFHRTKHRMDVEDAALQFVEDELGRHDFRTNWAKIKQEGVVQERLVGWLEAMNVDLNPNDIINYLDRLTLRAGRWR